MTTLNSIDNNGIQMTLDNANKSVSIDPDNGLIIKYDLLTANPKTFTISNTGMNFLDNTENNTTFLSRIALLQQALAAIEIPPNTTTLEVVSSVLVRDTGTNSIALDGVVPSVIIDDGTTTTTMGVSTLTSGASSASWADIIAGSAVDTLNTVLTAGNTATGANATISLTNSGVGYTTNPTLLINNSNATAGNTTGVPSIELTKTGRNGALNDVIGSVFFNALDGVGVERTFGKIESTITTNTAPSNYDGALDFYSLINGVNNLVFRLNGADNENNTFRPFDLNGNALKTSTGDLPINATSSTGTGHIDITSKTGAVVNVANSININASASTGNGFINLIPKVSTGAILTDSKIATLNGFPTNVGSSIDFGGGNPDNKFTLETTGLLFNQFFTPPTDKSNEIDIRCNLSAGDNYINQQQLDTSISQGVLNQNICNLTTQKILLNDNRTGNLKSITLDNNTSSSENRMDFIQNSGGGIVAQSVIVNTAGTQMLSLSHTDNSTGKAVSLRQDTGGTGKLQYDNTIDSSAFEITSNNTDLTLTANGGAGNCKVIASTLQFNNVNIIPRRTYNTFAFSVNGSPTGTILNFGPLADMVSNTIWKVDVAFYTGDGINTRNALTYVVQDNTPQYVEQNSVFGYTQGGLQTCIQFDPTGTPMGTYCSFTDTFEVGGLASGACSFILTGGTSNGSTWSGTCRVSIVLTRLS